jgi:hypothetical protein
MCVLPEQYYKALSFNRGSVDSADVEVDRAARQQEEGKVEGIKILHSAIQEWWR